MSQENVGAVSQTSTSSVVAPADSALKAAASTATMATIGTMADLKSKSPDVWKALMKTLAQNVMDEMRRSQEEIKKLSRQSRNAY